MIDTNKLKENVMIVTHREFKQFIKDLNSENIHQTQYDWEEDVSQELQDKYSEEFDRIELVASELHPDKHRWYELTTDVYLLNQKYFGVKKVSTLYSESMDVSDVYHHLEFFEMKAVQSISYIRKNK